MNNNHIIISYAPVSQATADATIRGYLISGYAGGAWNGPGIDSSAARPPTPTTAWAMPMALMAVVSGLPRARSKSNTRCTAMRIWTAWSTARTSASWRPISASRSAAWDQGDFNYDGVVNGTDFGALGGQLRPAGQRRRGGVAGQRLDGVGFLRRRQWSDGRCAGAGMRPRPRPDDPCRPFPTPFSFFLILMLADVG